MGFFSNYGAQISSSEEYFRASYEAHQQQSIMQGLLSPGLVGSGWDLGIGKSYTSVSKIQKQPEKELSFYEKLKKEIDNWLKIEI